MEIEKKKGAMQQCQICFEFNNLKENKKQVKLGQC
jgi:hypothetical protein